MSKISRTVTWTFLATLVLGLFPGIQAAPPIPDKDFSDSSVYKVVRIVDGDTVILLIGGKETRVRLIGVDTPETVHPRKTVEYYGREASLFTKNLLQGEWVYLEYGQERLDKYGRTLAYLFRVPDRLFVNFEIVRQGYGHAYTQFPFKYMELFRHYERTARESGKGLWGVQSGGPDPPVMGGSGGREPSDQGVRGVVVYVTQTGKKYHLGSCRYLSRRKISIALVDAKVRYSACKVCQPPR